MHLERDGLIERWTRKSRTRQAGCSMHPAFDSQGYRRRSIFRQVSRQLLRGASGPVDSTRMSIWKTAWKLFSELANTETRLGQLGPACTRQRQQALFGMLRCGMCARAGMPGSTDRAPDKVDHPREQHRHKALEPRNSSIRRVNAHGARIIRAAL